MLRKSTFTRLLILMASFLLATPVIARPAETGAKKCSDGIDNDGDGLIDGDDPDCGGTGGGSQLYQIDVVWDDGTHDTLNIDAELMCGSTSCVLEDASGSVAESFDLPDGVGPIIDFNSIKNTDLDSATCFDHDGDRTLSITEIGRVRFSVISSEARWILFVDGFACDMDSTATFCDVRDYEFKVQGDCVAGVCPGIPVSGGESALFDSGVWYATGSSGPDSKKGIPCRCTGTTCPDGTPYPVPTAEVTVSLPTP